MATIALSPLEAYEAEEKLAQLALETFAKYSFNFFPRFPNILVRLLDPQGTDRSRGGIILSQNTARPMVTAVVLRSWDEKEIGDVKAKSELQPGDLVQIPYWAGVPVDPYGTDDSVYRVVPEGMFADYNRKTIITARGASQEFPHIFYKCSLYDPLEEMEKLIDIIADSTGLPDFNVDRVQLAKQLLEKFTIMPK